MSIAERFVKSRVKLLRESPFFGTLLLNAKYEISDAVPTAATDGQVLLLNEEWMGSQSQPHFQSVILHEVLHMALEHVSRLEDLFKTDPRIANIAADIVVNGIIRDNQLSLPESAICDDELKHLSAREIYSILRKKQQEDPDYLKKKYGSKEANDCLKPGKSKSSGGEGDSENQSAEGSSFGAKTNWKDVLNKAATLAHGKRAGVMGAGMSRIFKDFLEPTINWRDALYKYVTAARTDFEGYDRRFIHTGQYLDDLGGGRIRVMVFMDTSGSVDEQLLSEFIAELRFAINALPSISGEMWYFDTELYPQGDILEIMGTPKLCGGGGTSFTKPMEKLKEMAEEDSTVQTLGIIFTDGYAPLRSLSEPENASVLWCISPGGVEDKELPFGEVIRIMK